MREEVRRATRDDVGDGDGGRDEETTRKRRRRMRLLSADARSRAGTRRTTRGTRATATTTTTTTTTTTDDARATPRWRAQDEELPANSEELQQAIKDWLTKRRTAAGKVKQVLGLLNHERLGCVRAFSVRGRDARRERRSRAVTGKF